MPFTPTTNAYLAVREGWIRVPHRGNPQVINAWLDTNSKKEVIGTTFVKYFEDPHEALLFKLMFAGDSEHGYK